ncbi:hypothetical protein [Caulobacter sp. NIBR1757]|uniref:hypothetical protein n=1 Tax=Caulobacter sp. NIBR1757 TaxID=3016000 RepID=UPI0022F12948|nr:hypothetical protein [Caulobacter sp. NIBR1757]WGM39137.1 hypothetical protein AMEJIAPC_02051 [Caulobacter sp. NIBR1757]
MPPYDMYQWITLLTFGGLVGAMGQGARTAVGLKKLAQEAAVKEVGMTDLIAASRIFVSLAIGFIAGSLGGIGVVQKINQIQLHEVMAIAAIGYAGADFIEGFIGQISKASRDGATPEAPPAAGADANDGALG